MTEQTNAQTITLAPLYKGWQEYQELLIKALAPLTTEQLELQAAPNLRSIYTIATHIIGARARWLSYVLKEGGETIIPFCTWDKKGQPVKSAAELVSGLESTFQILQSALQRWTIADLEDIVVDRDDDGKEETFTRQWVIWHLIEHDLHHGGEISFSLGMHNLDGIDI